MRPKEPDGKNDLDLYRSRLENLVDARHPLVRLARLIDWRRFEAAFGALYKDGVGRPGLSTRLMVGLHLLKHMDGLSDEAVCARYLDSPYVQLFCGESHFQHRLLLERSSMTRWRKRLTGVLKHFDTFPQHCVCAEPLHSAPSGAPSTGWWRAPAVEHWRVESMARAILIAAGVALWITQPALAGPGAPGHTHDHHGGTGHGATSTDGGPGKPDDVSRAVRVEATDDAFDVKQIQVRAGETVRFVITNAGYSAHEFAIASPKENEEHRAMMRQMPNMVHHEPNVVTVAPGETKELIWQFGKDRNVEFSCNIKDHAEKGMRGTFRVMQ